MGKGEIRILYVEDDKNLGLVIRDYLHLNGYVVELAEDGIIGWNAFISKKFDLCILDVMLPLRDGFDLADMIRKRDPEIPILFLTARGEQEDKLKGFRLGADDYIVKPFNIQELVCRVEVFLRRGTQQASSGNIFQLGNYTFDYSNLALVCQEERRTLTQKEADLLHTFCIHTGEVLKREDILNRLWGNDDYFSGRSLDVFISRLRKYLKTDPSIEIQNLHSVGYRLNIHHDVSPW